MVTNVTVVHARFGKTLAPFRAGKGGEDSGSPHPPTRHEPRQILVWGLPVRVSAEATQELWGVSVSRTSTDRTAYPTLWTDTRDSIATYCVSRPSPICH